MMNNEKLSNETTTAMLGLLAPVEKVKKDGYVIYLNAGNYMWNNVFFLGGMNDAVKTLAEMALPEAWAFGNANGYGVLFSYFKYTFFKAILDGKVATSDSAIGGNEVAIDTRLVTRTYDPIYAVFVKAPKGKPWAFLGFFAGGNAMKKKFYQYRNIDKSCFTGEIPRVSYLEREDGSVESIDLRKLKAMDLSNDHILEDNFSRLPLEFVSQFAPKEIDLEDLQKRLRNPSTKPKSVAEFKSLLEKHPSWKEAMDDGIKRAVERAKKRVEWNSATAIPTYFPTYDTITFLLPLSLKPGNQSGKESFDLALAVGYGAHGQNKNTYKAYTILTLDMAFNNARLVNRPASDWLRAEDIASGDGDGE